MSLQKSVFTVTVNEAGHVTEKKYIDAIKRNI